MITLHTIPASLSFVADRQVPRRVVLTHVPLQHHDLLFSSSKHGDRLRRFPNNGRINQYKYFSVTRKSLKPLIFDPWQ